MRVRMQEGDRALRPGGAAQQRGKAPRRRAVLLMASRGGSCPSNEVRYCAQPGARCEQKEEKRRGGGRGGKKRGCGARFTKQPPFCSPAPILCAFSQEGIKSPDPAGSGSTEMGE